MNQEGALKKAVAEGLDKTGQLYVRVNSGGYRGGMRGAPKGTPDFLGFLAGGRGFAIETKATHKDTCKCSSCDAQRAWAVRARARGVVYVLARTVEQALAGLGLLRRSG